MGTELKTLDNYRLYKRYSRTHDKEMTYAIGKVYKDTRFPDGSLITTTAIVNFQGDTIETTSGSIYRLGKEKQ